MIWSSEIFQAIHWLGWKGVWRKEIMLSEDQKNLIENVILTMENFTFSEIEKIQKESEKDSIYCEILEESGNYKIVEHTKYSIVKGIISNFRKGQEMAQKTKK